MIELRDPLETIREATDRLPEMPIQHDREQFPRGSPEHARFLAELERLKTLESLENPDHVPIVRISPREGEPPTYIGVEGSIRTIGTSRRCSHPVGLVLADPHGFEVTPVPCRKCPECHRWEQTVDRIRTAEAIAEPVLTFVPDDRWEATRKRLQRAALPYLAVPLEGGRRAIVTEAAYAGPVVGPVEDMTETLAQLDRKRDRSDRRRVSSSGLRTRSQVEAEVYEKRSEPSEREVVGFWNPRLLTRSKRLEQVSDDLDKAAAVTGVPHDRRAGSVVVKVGRHDPRAEVFFRRLGTLWLGHAVPWHEGGPPPTPDDPAWEKWEAARPKTWVPVVGDDPPLEAYRDVLEVYETHWQESA